MKQGYSHQFESASVVIEAGENPDIKELIEFAHTIGAVKHYEEEDIDVVVDDIVIDDQSGRYDPVGPELYEQDTLEQQVEGGLTTFHALVS